VNEISGKSSAAVIILVAIDGKELKGSIEGLKERKEEKGSHCLSSRLTESHHWFYQAKKSQRKGW